MRPLLSRLALGLALVVPSLVLLPGTATAAPGPGATHGGPGAHDAAGGVLSRRLEALARRADRAADPAQQSASVSLPPRGPGSLLRREGDLVAYVRLADTSPPRLRALAGAGAEVLHVAPAQRTATVQVPVDRLERLASVAGVRSVREALTPQVGTSSTGTTSTGTTSTATAPCGSRTSEGDTQLRAAAARGTFGVDGTGVEVGVLSDSYDRAAGTATRAAQDVASGDLPGTGNPCGRTTPVRVLEDSPYSGSSDEGRAMLQLVHDLAPGAPLSYATAFTGLYEFADNVRALRATGADVLVDDVAYFEEPFFQDGPVAVAVDEVVAAGASYFTAAGNSNLQVAGRDVGAYEAAAFRPVPCPVSLGFVAEDRCHDFDPGSAVDPSSGTTIAPGGQIVLDVQWAEPWFGVATDLDVYLFDHATGELLALSYETNEGGTPFEFVGWQNDTTTSRTVDLLVHRWGGTGTPRLKAINVGSRGVEGVERASSTEVTASTIFGHAAAAGAGSTAAVRYSSSDVPEPFSSRGRPTALFGPVVHDFAAAAPLSAPRVSAKPDYAATDGACTTFFSGPAEADGCRRFFGTSAAAPHVAAVAALGRQLAPRATPAEVQSALKAGAALMSGGTALSVGAGRIDAFAALARLRPVPDAFRVSDLRVREGATSADVRVSYSGYRAASVTAATASGSATSGSDFTATSRVLAFPAGGPSSLTLSVPLANGSSSEPAESFAVRLSAATTGTTVSDSSGTVTVDDDEPLAPQLVVGDVPVAVEGGAATFRVAVRGTTDRASRIAFATTDGSAVAADRGAPSQTTWDVPAGVADPVLTVRVPITEDTTAEGAETFGLRARLVSGTGLVVADATGTAVVAASDGGPSTAAATGPRVRVADVRVLEGGAARVTVSLDSTPSSVVGITAGTRPGTAGVSDHVARSATFSWAAGDSSPRHLDVQVPADGVRELVEAFTVALSGPTGGSVVADTSATVTVQDVDGLPPQLVVDDAHRSPAGSTVVLPIRLDLPVSVDTTLNLRTTGGTLAASSVVVRAGTVVPERPVALTLPSGASAGTRYTVSVSSARGLVLADPAGGVTVG